MGTYHRLGGSSELPPESPIPLRLTSRRLLGLRYITVTLPLHYRYRRLLGLRLGRASLVQGHVAQEADCDQHGGRAQEHVRGLPTVHQATPRRRAQGTLMQLRRRRTYTDYCVCTRRMTFFISVYSVKSSVP